MSIRKTYEKYHRIVLPKNVEVHHFIPHFAGGTDDISNLIAATKEEHKNFHLIRYFEHGDFRDLCSYHMIGYNFTEAHRISSSVGGTIGGNQVKKNKIGILGASDDTRKEWASMGGKIGGAKQRDLKIGIHSQTKEERLLMSSMGGKKGCEVNGWKDSKQQSERGKRGGPKNKGFVWITDETQQIKYTTVMQKIQSVEDYLKTNPKFRLGRIQQIIECPHCHKSGNTPTIYRYHFNNCKKRQENEN